jgi:hypothetical protein
MDDSSPATSLSDSAAAARRDWPVRKGTLAEMEQDQPSLAASTTVEERFALMWQLAQDAWAFRGEPVGEPPFPRHPVRLIRRGS